MQSSKHYTQMRDGIFIIIYMYTCLSDYMILVLKDGLWNIGSPKTETNVESKSIILVGCDSMLLLFLSGTIYSIIQEKSTRMPLHAPSLNMKPSIKL